MTPNVFFFLQIIKILDYFLKTLFIKKLNTYYIVEKYDYFHLIFFDSSFSEY